MKKRNAKSTEFRKRVAAAWDDLLPKFRFEQLIPQWQTYVTAMCRKAPQHSCAADAWNASSTVHWSNTGTFQDVLTPLFEKFRNGIQD